MTATNHVMMGAVIAVVVKEPLLAIPLAFASHFVLDAIPHFGIDESDVFKRNSNRLFQIVVPIDIILTIALLIIVPHLAIGKLAWGVTLACMIAALSPDFVWVYMFFREVRTKKWRAGGRFSRFHNIVQWYEKPPGIIIEVVWLAGVFTIFKLLI